VLLLASVLAVWLAPLRGAVLAGDGLVVLACLFDWLATPAPGGLAVARRLPERAGLSADFERVLLVEVGRAGGLALEVREEFSEALEVRAITRREGGASAEPSAPDLGDPDLVDPDPGDPTGGPDRLRLPASGTAEVRRVYRSSRRGWSFLGHMRLRLCGPLGLVQRQARLAGRGEIAIEPPLANLSSTLRLAASERWRDLGVRRLRRRGGLTEFESLREYVHGDDLRLVDWKAFARRGRPMVREYQEEHGQELILLVDCGRRMGATAVLGPGRGWTKLDFALDAALQLAAVALSKGDRVGILTFDAGVRAFVPPARGALQLARLKQAVFGEQASARESDTTRALREVGVRHRRRATLVVLSDVADPLSTEAQVRALETGARHHRVVFAGLDDPELRAVAEGRLEARAGVRAEALQLARERARGLAVLRRSGARVLDALPAEAAAPLLAAWLDLRRSGRA